MKIKVPVKKTKVPKWRFELHVRRKNEPLVTQKELALRTGRSVRTIKRRTVEMQDKGLIKRTNGKSNGKWEIVIEL